MTFSRFFPLIMVVVVLVLGCCSAEVREETFQAIRAKTVEKVVIFYNSTLPDFRTGLEVVSETAKRFAKGQPRQTKAEFYKCDCALEENEAHCESGSFSEYPQIFVASTESGIVLYPFALQTDALFNFASTLIGDIFVDELVPFHNENELDDIISLHKKPIFINFVVEWCELCRSTNKFFTTASLKLAGEAFLFRVDCDEHTAFCTKNSITEYPTHLLFPVNGDPVRYTGNSRDEKSMIQFVRTHALGAGGFSASPHSSSTPDRKPATKAPQQPASVPPQTPPPLPPSQNTPTPSNTKQQAPRAAQPESDVSSTVLKRLSALEARVADLEDLVIKIGSKLKKNSGSRDEL
eukprot:gnl/Spiro4/22990_TR11354_c0_g1_i1.p1 gnl/Spiro4/22990_TR11354_c0_g1~~gnl/Spiro4/22990_TR11354_c0_g1_i1.p1  ORF type:complete len:363 (+),score=70.55 gnl/Spiro4/22990_TR11354_c0_g1_i1:40-1089(+)